MSFVRKIRDLRNHLYEQPSTPPCLNSRCQTHSLLFSFDIILKLFYSKILKLIICLIIINKLFALIYFWFVWKLRSFVVHSLFRSRKNCKNCGTLLWYIRFFQSRDIALQISKIATIILVFRLSIKTCFPQTSVNSKTSRMNLKMILKYLDWILEWIGYWNFMFYVSILKYKTVVNFVYWTIFYLISKKSLSQKWTLNIFPLLLAHCLTWIARRMW